MEVLGSRRLRTPISLGSESVTPASSASAAQSVARLSGSCLTLYNDPPKHECTLSEFEQSAFDRLQILKHIETIKMKRQQQQQPQSRLSQSSSSSSEAEEDLKQLLQKYGHWQQPDRDVLSHHVLRLAYCRSEETRRWLLNAECSLFRWRFEYEPDSVVSHFLDTNKLNYITVNLTANSDLAEKLKAVAHVKDDSGGGLYYRVPFEEAAELIRDRRVYLEAGDAYISKKNLVHIVLQKYRANLSLHLTTTQRFVQSHAGRAQRDERIAPLLSSLAKQSLGPSYKQHTVEGQVTKDDLPALALSPSFPLCMTHLFTSLQQEHHLKHWGRMQLGLFLKGIGLSLPDALLFWKQSFARRTPPDKFDKEYAYNIRHNYGKEGKRTTYTPYSCLKIIQSQPAAQEHHGCPFKHQTDKQVKQMMIQRGVKKEGVEEVLTLMRGGHYQLACTRLFALTHEGQIPDTIGNHPNAYFDASRKIAMGGGATQVKEEGKSSSSTAAAGTSTTGTVIKTESTEMSIETGILASSPPESNAPAESQALPVSSPPADDDVAMIEHPTSANGSVVNSGMVLTASSPAAESQMAE